MIMVFLKMMLKECDYYLIDKLMKQLIYILILFLLFSCNSKKPENFIPKDKMISLLVDMKIASKTRNIKNNELKKNLNYMEFVYNKHKVDSTQFKENNSYYIDHIEMYQEIYAEVDRRLKDSLAKYEKQVKKTDSIRRKKLSTKKELKLEERSNPPKKGIRTSKLPKKLEAKFKK